VFGPLDQAVRHILEKLIGIKPFEFTTKFTNEEKVNLLTVLIDCIHETNEFRLFLNKRVEDKSAFNKEKMEVYQQIRDLEARQQEFVKQYADDANSKSVEQMDEELNQLKARLLEASRTEAKPLKELYTALERKRDNYQNQVASFED